MQLPEASSAYPEVLEASSGYLEVQEVSNVLSGGT